MSLAPDRHKYRNASLTPALLGISPHTTRQEALELLKYGLERQWTEFQRRMVLDKGNEIEALARPIVELLIGEELPPKRFVIG